MDHYKIKNSYVKNFLFGLNLFFNRNMFGVFEGDNSRTKIFIKNEKMKNDSLDYTR